MIKKVLFTICFVAVAFSISAQVDATIPANNPSKYTRTDSMYLVKLNNSGNLMIAGGVGLCGVGSYLIYQGTKVYKSKPTTITPTYQEDIDRNHRQGIIYMTAGGIGIAGGIILTAFGAKNKVDFKRGMKRMQLQTGILDNGNLGMAFSF
jgi:hypothetical protein